MKVWIVKSNYLEVDQYSFVTEKPDLSELKYAVAVREREVSSDLVAEALTGQIPADELDERLKDAFEEE